MKKLREVEKVGEGFAAFFCAKNKSEGAIVKMCFSVKSGEGAQGEDMCDSVRDEWGEIV